MNKFLSRKFLISVAAFLGSIGSSIAGIAIDNNNLMTVGIVCTMLSAAIYTAMETRVDAASVSSKTTATTIAATTTSKDLVEKCLPTGTQTDVTAK